jgi:putative hydrolases of HD superfamily
MNNRFVDFAENVSKLKRIARKGWVSQVGVKSPESVADHSFACAVLAMCLGDLKGINTEKLIRLALLHDLHEALIGDYDHFDKQRIGTEQAKKNQEQAIKDVFAALPKAVHEKYICLAEEYIRQETPEAKLVKQIDKLEMILQALQYEKEGYDRTKLQPFWDGVEGTITDPDMKTIFNLLNKRRK